MTRPTDAVRSAVLRSLAQAGSPAGLALVACSGGADSLALAAGAARAARASGWRIGAVVVDHRLQPGSEQVADAAAAQCREMGLDPVRVMSVDVCAPGGPEAAARAARYGALADAARDSGARAVLLAHSRSDQAETVLLGLARGSGARSLSGMAPVGELHGEPGVLLLRPVLELSRATLAQACADWGLEPWSDPHNDDPAYTRVRVRLGALPALVDALGPGVEAALARTARLLRDDDEALGAIAGAVLAERGGDEQERLPDCAWLAAQPPAVRRRIVQRLIVGAGAPASAVTAEHVHQVDRLVRSDVAGPISLPGRVLAVRAYGRLGFRSGQE